MSGIMGFLRRVKHSRWIDTRSLYAEWEQRHLRRLLPALRADCVFDVGANAGQYARMLREQAGWRGRIVSFEPMPDAAAELRRAAAGDPLWQIEEVALADSSGEREFNLMQDTQYSSLSAPRYDDVAGFQNPNGVQRQVKVRAESLADALERLRAQHGFARPFLKLDTQGMDVAIVRAAGRATMRHFVGMQSELAVRKHYASSVDYREALRTYEELGFELSAFVPNNAGHFPRLIETDCILVRADLMPSIDADGRVGPVPAA